MKRNHLVTVQTISLMLGFLFWISTFFINSIQWPSIFTLCIVSFIGMLILPFAIYTKHIRHILISLFYILSPISHFYFGLALMIIGP